jgi:hypothetical protein
MWSASVSRVDSPPDVRREDRHEHVLDGGMRDAQPLERLAVQGEGLDRRDDDARASAAVRFGVERPVWPLVANVGRVRAR